MKNYILTLAFIFGLLFSSSATTCVSLGNGVWDDPLTWSCGAVPSPGDTIIINAGDTVVLSSTEILYGAPMVIIVNGYFLFDTPAAKLHLECGSEVIISPTGEIASSGIGIASHNIKICGDEVWQGYDGPLLGPVIITGPLPVELMSFEGEQLDHQVTLNWRTATEYNNDFFTVEGSLDGFEWEDAVIIDGAGNSTQPLDYQVTYDNRSSGYVYFRLKQTDFNGQYTYSDIISVRNQFSAEFTVYPNPMSGSTVRIESSEFDSYDVMITSMSGNQVYFQPDVTEKELWINDLNMESGVYIISLTSNGRMVSKKMMKN